jgi:hypothetical protein
MGNKVASPAEADTASHDPAELPRLEKTLSHIFVIRCIAPSGKTGMAMSETVEKDSSKILAPGGFAYMPAGMVHYAWCEEESVISGNGPFDIIYANPKDDPRRQQGAK